MENAVVKKEQENGVQKASAWTPEQINLIKNTVAKGATDDEFKLFGYMAHKYSLDPLIREIWCVKYGTAPATMFAGRDGFLSIAHRSGMFNGLKTEPMFDTNGNLISATCSVYKKGMDNPIQVTVYLKEYNTGKSNWLKMPITMLCKVAESQALRKAFNISGIYSEEEQGAVTATVATGEVESLSEDMERQLRECSTKQELEALWKANPVLQKKAYFINAVKARKEELANPHIEDAKVETVEYTAEVEHSILICESAKDIQTVWDVNPELQNNQAFINAVNERKAQILTPQKKTA